MYEGVSDADFPGLRAENICGIPQTQELRRLAWGAIEVGMHQNQYRLLKSIYVERMRRLIDNVMFKRVLPYLETRVEGKATFFRVVLNIEDRGIQLIPLFHQQSDDRFTKTQQMLRRAWHELMYSNPKYRASLTEEQTAWLHKEFAFGSNDPEVERLSASLDKMYDSTTQQEGAETSGACGGSASATPELAISEAVMELTKDLCDKHLTAYQERYPSHFWLRRICFDFLGPYAGQIHTVTHDTVDRMNAFEPPPPGHEDDMDEGDMEEQLATICNQQ